MNQWQIENEETQNRLQYAKPINNSLFFKCTKCGGYVTTGNLHFVNDDVTRVQCWNCQNKLTTNN